MDEKLKGLETKFRTMPLQTAYTGGPMLDQPTLTWCADQLAALTSAVALQTCDKQFHMYVWQRVSFLGIAQAKTVAEARELMLEEIEAGTDGSCPEREAADKYVREQNPHIFHFANASFALTDSAELREQEDYSNKLQKQVDELKAKASAVAPTLTEEHREEAIRLATHLLAVSPPNWSYATIQDLAKRVLSTAQPPAQGGKPHDQR